MFSKPSNLTPTLHPERKQEVDKHTDVTLRGAETEDTVQHKELKKRNLRLMWSDAVGNLSHYSD